MRSATVALAMTALLLPTRVGAETVASPTAGRGTLSYDAYVAGLHVFTAQAGVALAAQSYAVNLDYRTSGLYGALVRGDLHSSVEGRFIGDRPQPERFFSRGWWHGGPRETLIDYASGQPQIRALVPPNAAERDPVPPALQTGAAEPLSAVAMLVRRLGETGRCDGSERLFDGRRLSEITVRTAGPEVLAPDTRSSFYGTAMRCDFEGRQLAGFLHDADDGARKPRTGTAWLAPVLPGTPPLPVRLSFHLGFLGDVTMYLTGAK
jgi:hypothetical protein